MNVLNFCEKCAISMILSVSILNAAATTFDKPTENQMHLLHNTVKALLDFKTDPTVSNEQRKSYARSNDAVAKYMKELFKRYKTFGDDISMGTTVRSIAPKIDVINGREALVFSLQSLKPNEEIIRAEIHYNLGKPSKSFVWKQKKSKEIRCIRLRPSSTTGSSADLELPQATDHSEEIFDWIAFDAQTSVIATLDDKSSAFSSPPSNNGSSVPHALGVAFATKNHHDGKYKRLSAKKSLRHHSPFLLIFTDEPSPPEDTQERVLSAVGVVREASNEEDSSPEENENETVNRAKRHVTSVGKGGDADASKYYHYSVDDRDAQQVQDADRSATNRVKAFQSQGPTVLQDTKQLRRHRKIKPRKYNNGLLPTPRKYQPFGAESTVDNGRRSNGEKEKNRKRTTQAPLPFPSVDVGTKQKQLLATAKHQQQRWTGGQATHENDATLVLLETEQPEVCQKRDLVVEFSDIGWGEWIIAPKSFEAHYCSGACPFPLPPNSNPSNHAVIQSIIHAVGLHPAVPQVCCSPEKMDSLTLLYFDEEQNVVLKNYPKMTVSSCGCL